MPKKLYFAIFSCLFLIGLQTENPLAAQSTYPDLRVLNPQQQWVNVQGSIDKASVVVRPRGLYLLVDLYLTISAGEMVYYFSPNDQLEIVLDFHLPESSMVIDSWLWIGDTIIKAKLLDRWTAGGIYEEVVNRQQDPSILYKEGDNQYQLRIYPMKADRSRRVKISYLVPFDWTATHVTAPLPLDILSLSARPVPYAIRVFNLDGWPQPDLPERPDAQFTYNSDPELEGQFLEHLPAQWNGQEPLHIRFRSPMQNGVYLNRYAEGEDQFYQLAFLPRQFLELDTVLPAKTLLLLDYAAGKSTMARDALIEQLKTALTRHLQPTDSFNVMYARFGVETLSTGWLPADPATINRVFADFNADDIGNYSSLINLLYDGIDYLRVNNGGSLLLFSNSDAFGQTSQANPALNDILAYMEEQRVPVHIVDYHDQDMQYYWINDRSFIGNEYFYLTLSQLTGGSYHNLRDGGSSSFSRLTDLGFEGATALQGLLDVQTSLAAGFTYNRYTVGRGESFVQLNRPFLQVGRYEGEFPFRLAVTASLNGQLYHQARDIPQTTSWPTDTIAEQIWAGNHIAFLERTANPANALINQIILESLNSRVLSRYTAFICLEPRLGGEPCEDCTDEGGSPTDTDDPVAAGLIINIAPNPFRDLVSIRLELPEGLRWEEVEVSIHNTMGQLVQRFGDKPGAGNAEWTVEWNGTGADGRQLPAGVYYLVVQWPGGQQTRKLVYMP